MYGRPKPSDTEDDLLRMQEEFFKSKAENKIKPAATVVGTKDEGKKEENNSVNMEVMNADIEEQLANTFEAVPADMKLKNIEEKNPEVQNVSIFKFNRNMGFPKAKRRDPNIVSGKGSIFSQHFKRFKKDEVPINIDTLIPTSLVIKERTENQSSSSNTVGVRAKLPDQSYILTGTESKQMHEENLTKIKNMSEKEILEEKEKLIATMDPAIVAFLKSRRKEEPLENKNPTIKEQNKAAEDFQIEEIKAPAELLTNPESEKWLNFNIIESNKLAWMKNVNIPKTDKKKSFEARFDFEGWLMPYSEPEINDKNRILYHHGEEAGRPGYTLQELFQLSRSSIIQQKIIALNCIANILSLNSTGIYDDIIEIPTEQIFFVLRFCLDDNTPSVLNASIKAMKSLIYFQLDETCLDNLLGFGLGLVQPALALDNKMEDDYTVNDQQLAETNIVKCLARTDILTRIRYIINTVKPPLETIVYCMDILIRMSRDSDFILNKILECEGLIDSIIKNFVPTVFTTNPVNNSAYGLPLVQAAKLLRIISSKNKVFALRFVTKYKIMEAISIYLTDETFSLNANGLHLQIECMHFWSLLLHYGLTYEYLRILEVPVILRMLDHHLKNTDLTMKTTLVRQSHVAALLILLNQISKTKYVFEGSHYPLLIEQCLTKWSVQFSNLSEFSCGKLQIISSMVYYLAYLRNNQHFNKTDEIILALIKSKGFKVVTEQIGNGSMLLNNYETHKSGSNLRSLESAAWHTIDHVIPIMQTNSCMPFLYCVALYVNHCDNHQVKLAFLNHQNILKYLKSLQKLENYFLTSNWFTRSESFVIMEILQTSVKVKDFVDTSIFYELAVKSLSAFNCEQKPDIEYLFNNIIFCSKFYPSEVLLKNLEISQRNDKLETSLSNLGEILQVYTQVLGLRKNVPEFSCKACVDVGIGNVIPIDWIYTPIIVLYSNQQQNKNCIEEAQQIFTIKNCLRWILIYETYFPFLSVSINPTDRFCRLACVFLGSDSLFLNEEIHGLLENCFKNVIKFEKELDFQKEIQGLNNFQDFYTQLLEQYQGVSYGDTLFGNIILVPLAQKHNVQFRKTLWSEYMGAVQIFNVTPDQALCDIDLFLSPCEENTSLLNSYRRALTYNMIRRHSVLYKIASHHVEQFILSHKQKNK